MPQENETLVIESADSIKSLEVKDGKARVGAYAIRFSGPNEKDLQGEYFTPKTYLGSRKGDGADVLFNHGQPPTKAFNEICDRVFAAAKATADEVGIFVEHVLNLSDEYEAAIAGLCSKGKLKWSSGATSHMVKRTDAGEIKRWPIAEFSYTPTPAEPRLPAIAPLKSATVDDATASEIAEEWDTKAVWSTAYINTLPDSAFLYIEPGGKKDSDGKTTPRSLRHFPYKDDSGKIDVPHLRNALARIPQSNVPQSAKDEATARAKRLLADATRSTDMVELSDASIQRIADAVDKQTAAEPQITRITMTPEEKAAKEAAEKAQKEAAEKSVNDRVASRNTEISEMYEIGDSINDRELARKFIKEGKSLDEFRAHVLTDVLKAKPVNTDAGLVGMSGKEVKKYSLRNAIFQMATKGRLDGVEKEAHEAAIKTLGRDIESKGFFVPDDVSRAWGRVPFKGNNVTTATSGGFLVETDFGPMIELLRNKPQVVAAGATTLAGLVGDLALPVQTGASTAYWVSETGSLTDSSATFGQKKLTPKRLGATIPYTTQFLAQASIDAEAFIRDDAVRVLSIEKDRAALLGAGVNGEPMGLANTPSIGSHVTYGTTATWAKVLLSETSIGAANADIGPMAWLLDSSTVGSWKGVLRSSVAGAKYLIDDNMTANGYPVFKSNQVNSAHQSFFGVWSQLVLAQWSGLEVIVDPYALKKSGQVEITFNELVDIVCRQPSSFEVSVDSAAQ